MEPPEFLTEVQSVCLVFLHLRVEGESTTTSYDNKSGCVNEFIEKKSQPLILQND